jgi:dehydrogenase/reductase SDR family member 1
LATDPRNSVKSGTVQVVAELATEYGFTDVNVPPPPSIRSLRFLLYNYALDDAMRARIPASWIPDIKLPFWLLAQGRPPETT